MTHINLESPGKLWATAENAKDYQFLIVKHRRGFTRDAFEKNPSLASGSNLIFRSPVVADKGGRGEFDLTKKKKDIAKKLKATKTRAKLVVIANQKPDNKEPRKKTAEVHDCVLINPASVSLSGIRVVARAQDWVKYHHPILFVELVTQGAGLKEVKVKWGKMGGRMPMFAFWELKSPGKPDIKRMIFGSAGDPHSPTRKCPHPPHMHRGGWWGDQNKGQWRGKINMWQGYATVPVKPGVSYCIGIYPRGGGATTLTASGTGSFSSLSDRVTLTMAGRHPHPGD
ncbi:hypothetical protein ACFL59_09405 [Planctomycetota bacterium]